jgi:hypothetical protein
MIRKLLFAVFTAGTLLSVTGSTLQRLALNDLIVKSTMIVQGSIQPATSAAQRGALIYTHYQLAVSAVYKGAPTGQTIDIAVPGGALNGIEQPVAGAPSLTPGQNYLIFLWTSKSGLTQVIGLSQGLFTVSTNAQGQVVVSRAPANATMLDASGNPVPDSSFQMPLAQMVSTIQGVLAGGGSGQ